MRALPLFHRVAGRPVVVLGEGAAAEAKRRMVERAGGEVVAALDEGIARGARLAFIAHDERERCEDDAAAARAACLLVNVVDRPDLCEFTTPSILERDPVLVAIGTDGASAGLAKQLRLRLEALLPADLGTLATRLSTLREAIRARFADPAERRRALDRALAQGGPLDPFAEGAATRIEPWLADRQAPEQPRVHTFALSSTDPEELTLRQARLLGSADAVLHDAAVPPALLDRARADAVRLPLPQEGAIPTGLVVILRLARGRA